MKPFSHSFFYRHIVRSCVIVVVLLQCYSSMIAQENASASKDSVGASSGAFSSALKIGLFGAWNANYHAASFLEIPDNKFLFSFPGSPFLQVTRQISLDTLKSNPDIAFSSTLSFTPAFGLSFESPFSPFWGMAARLSYTQHNSTFFAKGLEMTGWPAQIPIGVDPEPIPYRVDKFYKISLTSLALEPLFMFTPWAGNQGNLGLKIYVGGRIGYMLVRESESSQMYYVDSLVFDSSKLTPSPPFTSANPLTFSASAGLGYDIPLDFLRLDAAGQDKLILAPEVIGMWGLNQVATVNGAGATWNLHQVRAGVSLFYRRDEIRQRLEEMRRVDTIEVYKKPPIRIPFMVGISRFVRDTVMTTENGIKTRLITERLLRTDTLFVPPPPRMDVSVTAVSVESNGTEKPIVQVRFEEFLAQRYVPLLNYVFFDDQAFALPPRYKRLTARETSAFEVDKLYKSGTLDIYYHLLNIVGKRMMEHPDAVLTLTGCNSDVGGEAGNGELSEQRAETIRRYFADVWKIAPNRLVMQSRNLSEQPSLPKTEAEKIEENRRVELSSNVREILDPVLLSDTVRTANPPIVRFKPRAKTTFPVNDWTLLVNYHDEEMKRFSSAPQGTSDSVIGTTEFIASPMPPNLDWYLLRQDANLLKIPGPFQFILTATDANGKSGVGYGTIPVEQLTLRKKRKEYRNDREFEQFSLILFQFNRAEIGERNQNIINFMKERVKPSSKLSIAGYTDRTGDAAYNRNLSKQRASELARMLGTPTSTAQGFGEDQLLYDNNLPEGRFYCRTVNVSIETPVKYGE